MERRTFERFGEWTKISAATYGAALLGLFTYRVVHGRMNGASASAWWPEFTSAERLSSWMPWALLWGTAFVAPAIWSLDRTNLWKSIPQFASAGVVASVILSVSPGWLGATLASAILFGMLAWIRCHRNRIYDAPRHSSGYGSGRA